MIRLIRFLITGDWHLHEWDPYGKRKDIYAADGSRYPVEFHQPCRCKHCGKIKSFKL